MPFQTKPPFPAVEEVSFLLVTIQTAGKGERNPVLSMREKSPFDSLSLSAAS